MSRENTKVIQASISTEKYIEFTKKLAGDGKKIQTFLEEQVDRYLALQK
jgi:hypothetical protein